MTTMHVVEGAGVSVDVQDQLLKERTRKRRPGVIPYPVQYSRELLVYDNWNNVFLTSLCRSLTMHHFDSPPATVLDLGCGDGQWVIEAAMAWPESTFVGFDIEQNQPDLSYKGLEMKYVANRVKWVHGNLLEELPFPSNHFNFVRICCIGLGVPEDEWQDLLEEVARVMVPGGAIEIIEEDLIFPCGPSRRRDLLEPIAGAQHIPGYGSSSSSLNFTAPQSTAPSVRRLSSLSRGPSSPPIQTHMQHSIDSNYNEGVRHEMDEFLDPQDHSRLKKAWQEMLHRRFLTPKLLSVLPFYLSSSFRDIQTHPTLHISLPPNSHFEDGSYTSHAQQHDESSDLSALFMELKKHAVRMSTESRADSNSVRSRRSTNKTVSQWASIHLARSVEMIRGCKKAIWDEWKEIQTSEGSSSDAKRKQIRMKHEEFEAAWANWENDMRDRMAMRNRLQEALSWDEPPGERPEWRVWRERAGDFELPDTDSQVTPSNACRSLRAFVGWKPDNAAHGVGSD